MLKRDMQMVAFRVTAEERLAIARAAGDMSVDEFLRRVVMPFVNGVSFADS